MTKTPAKLFSVHYRQDNTTDKYSLADTRKYLDLFKSWYPKVSCGGQRFTRTKAHSVIVAAYRKEQLVKKVKECAVSSAASVSATAATQVDKEVMTARIAVMKVTQLKAELRKHNLNESGLKAELVKRLCEFHKCELPKQYDAPTKPKHKVKWQRKKTKNNRPALFSDTDFNKDSLKDTLPGFPDRMPEPWECHNFYFTDNMWDLGHRQSQAFPKWVNAQEVRPPWTAKNNPWPPKWVNKPLCISLVAYQFFTFILYMMGLKRLGRNNLRHMFSQDKLLQEVWIKNLCTRDSLEAFLRQLHFENSADPWGRKFPHSTNYRPNGVPKVRQMYLCACMCVHHTHT